MASVDPTRVIVAAKPGASRAQDRFCARLRGPDGIAISIAEKLLDDGLSVSMLYSSSGNSAWSVRPDRNRNKKQPGTR